MRKRGRPFSNFLRIAPSVLPRKIGYEKSEVKRTTSQFLCQMEWPPGLVALTRHQNLYVKDSARRLARDFFLGRLKCVS
jgi:hypothetical protein